jgi:hypothetical protein
MVKQVASIQSTMDSALFRGAAPDNIIRLLPSRPKRSLQ